MDDRDPLAGYELDAWQAPPPAVGLADRVIAKLAEAPRVAALDVPLKSRARWWIAGAGLALVASATVILVLGTTNPEAPREGAITTTRPAHLALGTSSAELEAGTEIRWRRSGKRVWIEQLRGVATWRAGGRDELMIDAGAAVATVEATGASLRVEVQMNQMDAKVFGASAVTAAAVAAVTIAVYTGHVDVRGQGQTVNVMTGETVAVKPDKPIEAVGAPPWTIAPPESGVPDFELRQLQATLVALEVPLRACGDGSFIGTLKLAIQITKQGTVGRVTPNHQVAFGSCLERVLKAATFATMRTEVVFSHLVTFTGNCDLPMLEHRRAAAKAAGRDIESFQITQALMRCRMPEMLVHACRFSDVTHARTLYAELSPAEQYNPLATCLMLGTDPRPEGAATAKSCDAEALASAGHLQFQAGQFPRAALLLDASLHCKFSDRVVGLAVTTACKAKDMRIARTWWPKLSGPVRPVILQTCLENWIDPR